MNSEVNFLLNIIYMHLLIVFTFNCSCCLGFSKWMELDTNHVWFIMIATVTTALPPPLPMRIFKPSSQKFILSISFTDDP